MFVHPMQFLNCFGGRGPIHQMYIEVRKLGHEASGEGAMLHYSCFPTSPGEKTTGRASG